MIYKLQRKFVLISTVSILAVIVLVFGVIFALNISLLNKNMDVLTDQVSEGGGRFPGPHEEKPRPDKNPPKKENNFEFITPETPFSTRHFTVLFDRNGNVSETHTESIYSISQNEAVEYAERVIGGKRERGWISNYRYKVYSTDFGTGVVFVDGSVNKNSFIQSITIAGIVLLVCSALAQIFIFIFSKKAVKPIAESYEKQKQFITDANHELKTPLTLILANLDIAEEELGKNEWLSDIRTEGNRMTGLVNQLVALSRMDEDSLKISPEQVAFGALVSDMVAEFEVLAHGKALSLREEIDRSVTCTGDRNLLQQLLGILMDNAIKDCDAGGEIFVSLQKGRQTVLAVENTYAAIEELELDRLFDRFYRADKARTFTGGYGVGLSLAKAIVEKHKGSVTAYRKDKNHIGFKVVLR